LIPSLQVLDREITDLRSELLDILKQGVVYSQSRIRIKILHRTTSHDVAVLQSIVAATRSALADM